MERKTGTPLGGRLLPTLAGKSQTAGPNLSTPAFNHLSMLWLKCWLKTMRSIFHHRVTEAPNNELREEFENVIQNIK